MLFDEKDKYKVMVDACIELTVNLNRGDVLPHEEIEKASGIERYSTCWNSLIKKLRRRLRIDRGLSIWPVHSVGYKLCTHDEQLNMVAEKLQRQAVRRATRAIKEVTALPDRELSMFQRRIKQYRVDSMKTQRRLLKRAIHDQRNVAKKTETMPRRQIPVMG